MEEGTIIGRTFVPGLCCAHRWVVDEEVTNEEGALVETVEICEVTGCNAHCARDAGGRITEFASGAEVGR